MAAQTATGQRPCAATMRPAPRSDRCGDGDEARGLRFRRTRAEDEDRHEERQREEREQHAAAARAQRERACTPRPAATGPACRQRSAQASTTSVSASRPYCRPSSGESTVSGRPVSHPVRRDLAAHPAGHRMRRERHLLRACRRHVVGGEQRRQRQECGEQRAYPDHAGADAFRQQLRARRPTPEREERGHVQNKQAITSSGLARDVRAGEARIAREGPALNRPAAHDPSRRATVVMSRAAHARAGAGASVVVGRDEPRCRRMRDAPRAGARGKSACPVVVERR